MLDNDNQLAAFKKLNESGFTAPPSVMLATSTAGKARTFSAGLTAVLLSTLTYPSNITTSVAKIKAAIATLDTNATAAEDFAGYFVTFQSPSELLNVSIGWKCYLKGAGLPDTTLPGVVTALADVTVVKAVLTVLTAMSITDVVAVMNEINTTLTPAAGSASTSGASAATTATVSSDQASRLAAACLALETRSKALTSPNSNLVKLTAAGKASVATAKQSFSNAVGIALLNSMQGDAYMGGAINAITPPAVLTALNGGS